MTCPSCGRPLDVAGVFPGGTVACACGAAARVTARVAPSTSDSSARTEPVGPSAALGSTCPRCSEELLVRDAEGVVVSACPKGHGLLVTKAALDELRSVAHAATVLDGEAPTERADPQPDDGAIPCPRCAAPMTRRAVGSEEIVVLDVCADHGTWFDAGELRAAVAKRRAPRSDGATADVADRADQAKATLDVALALELARDEETGRRAVSLGEDLLETFFLVVYGGGYRPRRRRTWR